MTPAAERKKIRMDLPIGEGERKRKNNANQKKMTTFLPAFFVAVDSMQRRNEASVITSNCVRLDSWHLCLFCLANFSFQPEWLKTHHLPPALAAAPILATISTSLEQKDEENHKFQTWDKWPVFFTIWNKMFQERFISNSSVREASFSE